MRSEVAEKKIRQGGGTAVEVDREDIVKSEVAETKIR